MAIEDVIFAKKRHFYGGIEPSNMTRFNASMIDGEIALSIALPKDTIINGQTLCTVAGALIRRRHDTFPQNEFDGELVANIISDTTIIDKDAINSGACYYAAFPYTTQEVFNRNSKNRVAINEYAPLQQFTATINSEGQVVLNVEFSEDISGVIIRKSTTFYPLTETDGENLFDIASNGEYIDTTVENGQKYYYSAFPYTIDNTIHYNLLNRVNIIVGRGTYVYGYDIILETSDSDARVVYPEDVDNANFTPAYMDYTTNSFNYGDWALEPGEHFMPRPCVVRYDGSVDYYLDPNNYLKCADGETDSNIVAGFDGNVMIEWPKIFTKRWAENGVYHFRCSDMPQDDDWDCWCNYDRDDNQIDHFYTAAFLGNVGEDSNHLRSSYYNSGNYGNLLKSDTIFSVRSKARVNGIDWDIETVADRLLIQDLLVLMAKTTNTQTAYGQGKTYGSSLINIGSAMSQGMFWGSSDTSKTVKVFGMEDYWGNGGKMTVGWICKPAEGQYWLKLTRGMHDGSVTADYNLSGDGYLTIEDVVFPSAVGYITSMRTLPYGRIPEATGGSSSTYECDYCTLYSTSSNIFFPSFGGSSASDGYNAGAFAWYTSYTTYTGSMICAMLSCKPHASIQNKEK